ncbi:hypothetical protein [Idiomarina abyssalis]|uniref:Uncharacterized protein n=1 Tax=Idiomarina abyssalis TaxID=86102 RepID=A0A8I1KK38_9GAMM|nr:hypothetical protein [Idiomarina abyssalis]MBJ7265597.1 hypothetical protein [Idiomarina abyssalis]MBJ7316729.1 hypothetical protein [Idiomarina abyssalis]
MAKSHRITIRVPSAHWEEFSQFVAEDLRTMLFLAYRFRMIHYDFVSPDDIDSMNHGDSDQHYKQIYVSKPIADYWKDVPADKRWLMLRALMQVNDRLILVSKESVGGVRANMQLDSQQHHQAEVPARKNDNTEEGTKAEPMGVDNALPEKRLDDTENSSMETNLDEGDIDIAKESEPSELEQESDQEIDDEDTGGSQGNTFSGLFAPPR